MNKKASENNELSATVDIAVENNKPMVSSLVVAEFFEKQHKNVLQSINELEIPNDFRRLNFQPSSYLNKQNKEQPSFNITRDGFSLLTMGFTGKKAMEWKIKFLEAFNAMEERLKGSEAELKFPLLKADPEEIRCFEGFARYWCYLVGISWEEGKSQIENAVNIFDLNNINRLALRSAWTYVRACLYIVPHSFSNMEMCSDGDLSPVRGLLDYWAYSHNYSRDELEDNLCKRMNINSLKSLPKCYLPNAISLVWENLNHEMGKHYAVEEADH